METVLVRQIGRIKPILIIMNVSKEPSRLPTGVPGLDEVLLGGLPQAHTYLVEGHAGTGKTTLGLQFVVEGARAGERCLYVTLSETRRSSKKRHSPTTSRWTGYPLPNLCLTKPA